MTAAQDRDRRRLTTVVVLTITGALLRLTRIGESLGRDEFFTAAMMELSVPDIIISHPRYYVHPLIWTDITPPLHYVGTRLVTLVLGTGDIAMRLLPWAAGVATIPAIYLLGRELWNHRTGLGSALLVTISTAHILHSQTARAYALFLLLTTLSMLFLVRTLRTGTRQDMAGFIGTTLGALYTSYLAGFLVVGTGLVLLYQYHRGDIAVWRWLMAGTGIGLLFLPHLPEMLASSPASSMIGPDLTLGRIRTVLAFLFNGTGGAVLVGGLAGLGIATGRSDREQTMVASLFLMVAALGVLWLGVSGSLRPRYAFPLLIPVLLLAGRGMASLPRRWMSGLIVVLLLGTALGSAAEYRYDTQPWETAVDYTTDQAGDTPIVIHSPGFRYAFERYGDGSDRDWGLHAASTDRDGADRILSQDEFRWLNRRNQTIWLVLRPRNRGIPPSISLLDEQYSVTGIRLGHITVLRLGQQPLYLRCPDQPSYRPGRRRFRCTTVTVDETGLVQRDWWPDDS